MKDCEMGEWFLGGYQEEHDGCAHTADYQIDVE